MNISGANASTYTLTDSDVGSTVDVIVSATNTGGATDANADATSTIAAAPVVSSGGGSSGGSGGTSGGSSGGTSGGSSGGSGGAGSPDLVVAASASNSNPAVGDTVLVFVTVTDANLKPAQGLYVNMTFDSGLQFVSSTADRGSGCTASSTTTLKCFLDWLSSDVSVGRFQVALKVGASGQHTVSATATSQQAVLTAAHSTTTLTLDQTPSSSSSSSSSGSTSGVPNGLSGSVPTVTKKKDKTRPTINALSSVGRRGRTANLRYRIHDDSGVAKALATVRRGRVVVATMSTGFGPVASEGVYYSGWHVPAKAKKGTYSFCLTAVDRAGNKSARSCAPLAVK